MMQDTEISNSSWIWFPGQEEKARHQYACFRKSFNLRNPQGTAVLDISADSDFVLFVNWHETGRGSGVLSGCCHEG